MGYRLYGRLCNGYEDPVQVQARTTGSGTCTRYGVAGYRYRYGQPGTGRCEPVGTCIQVQVQGTG